MPSLSSLHGTVVTFKDANGDDFHVHLGRNITDDKKAEEYGLRLLAWYVKKGATNPAYPVKRV